MIEEDNQSEENHSSNVPCLSVITVCYNSARTVRRTIESVASQKYANIEYIVIDGGSTDDTMSIVSGYPHTVSKFVSEPDGGIYDAMNKGIRIASGEWIHILNSDDYYADPDVLSSAMSMLNPRGINYFKMWREFEDGRRELQSWSYSRWQLFISAFLPHPTLIVSRQQYEMIGLYNTEYQIASDHDMILRLTAKWPGIQHNLVLTVMQQGGASFVRLDESLREFGIVTERHGLPRLARICLQNIKRIWWGI